MDKRYKDVLNKVFTLDFAKYAKYEATKQAQLKKLPPGLQTETLAAYVLLGNN